MPRRACRNFGNCGEPSRGLNSLGMCHFDDAPQPAPRCHVDGAGGAGQAGGARDTTPLSRSGGRRRRPVNTASRAPQGSSRRWARSQLVQPAARPARQGSRSTELSPRGLQGRPSGGGADDGGASAAKVHLGRHVGGRRPGRGAAWVALRAVSSDASCLWWFRSTRRLGDADENESSAGPAIWSQWSSES